MLYQLILLRWGIKMKEEKSLYENKIPRKKKVQNWSYK